MVYRNPPQCLKKGKAPSKARTMFEFGSLTVELAGPMLTPTRPGAACLTILPLRILCLCDGLMLTLLLFCTVPAGSLRDWLFIDTRCLLLTSGCVL